MRASPLLAGLCLLGAAAIAHAAWPDITWQVALDGTSGARLSAPKAALDPAGNIAVVGRESSSSRDCMFVAKVSARDGATLWRKSVCDLDSEAQAVAVDAEGHVVVGGAATTFGQSNARVLKFDGADGRVHWERTIDLASTGEERVAGLAIDRQLEIYVAVSSTFPTARLLKYSGGGTLRWQSEPVRSINALGLDALGTPYVAGTIVLGGAGQWAVTRVVPGSGVVAWRQWTNVAGSEPRALAFDAAGDVYATGITTDPTGIAMHTVKYLASNGSEQWQKGHATAAEDVALAVAIDRQNEVIVAGRSGLAAEVFRLRAVDGLLHWRTTMAPRGGRAGEASSIAFEPSGNVIVGGDEAAATGSTDSTIRTTALALESGAELWSVPLEGANGSADIAGIVLASDAAVFMVGENATRGQVVIARYGFAAVPSINVQALWWRSPANS